MKLQSATAAAELPFVMYYANVIHKVRQKCKGNMGVDPGGGG